MFVSSVLAMLVSATVGMLIPVWENVALWICLIGVVGLCATPICVYKYAYVVQLIQGFPKYTYTNKGRKIFLNLMGLKEYLQDYSVIEERTKEDLILWEEYIIYSVMFGINDKIIKEVYQNLK